MISIKKILEQHPDGTVNTDGQLLSSSQQDSIVFGYLSGQMWVSQPNKNQSIVVINSQTQKSQTGNDKLLYKKQLKYAGRL